MAVRNIDQLRAKGQKKKKSTFECFKIPFSMSDSLYSGMRKQ